MNADAIINHISNWLKDYCETSGMKGFVVGISGGIDSALTSTLCARTGLPVLAISMPIHQKPDQLERANLHIDWLCKHYPNVDGTSCDLTATFDTFGNSVPKEIQDDLSMANARARLRMSTLYTYASHLRRLVAGTGNKIEDFGVGFFTKYGDGGVDVSPIADLMKSDVYALCRHLNVITQIQTASPTDGLWEDDRTDESQLGATYDELEKAMNYLAHGTNTPLSEHEAEVLAIYQRFHNANLHKMLPIPVCQIPEELR